MSRCIEVQPLGSIILPGSIWTGPQELACQTTLGSARCPPTIHYWKFRCGRGNDISRQVFPDFLVKNSYPKHTGTSFIYTYVDDAKSRRDYVNTTVRAHAAAAGTERDVGSGFKPTALQGSTNRLEATCSNGI